MKKYFCISLSLLSLQLWYLDPGLWTRYCPPSRHQTICICRLRFGMYKISSWNSWGTVWICSSRDQPWRASDGSSSWRLRELLTCCLEFKASSTPRNAEFHRVATSYTTDLSGRWLSLQISFQFSRRRGLRLIQRARTRNLPIAEWLEVELPVRKQSLATCACSIVPDPRLRISFTTRLETWARKRVELSSPR